MHSRDPRSDERLGFRQPLARRGALAGALLALAIAFAACTPGPASPAPQARSFDSARAWKDLEKLVAIGPRQSGTLGAEATRVYLEQELRAVGLSPLRETFTEKTPAGDIAFTNLYVDLQPKTKVQEWILFCAHYDTKRMPFTFVGANDAGSGTALLLELARSLAQGPTGHFGYRLLFLDGEEAVNETWVNPDNRYGSRYHAKRLRDTGKVASFKACVLFDMIGDKDLVVQQEGYSDPRLYDVFAKSAGELKLGAHFASRRGQEILDDHLSFMDVGIRSVDLIDFAYGPNNSWWHKPDDVLANCSQQSLEIVGRVVLNALPALEKHLRP